jgi:hypothetical protein
MWTPAEIIDIAKVSQYLVGNDLARKGLLSGGHDPRWERMLYVERGSLQWMYNLDPTESTLEKTAYYVYALCGKWARIAEAAMRSAGVVPGQSGGGSGTGGSVINPQTGNPVAFDFVYLIPIKGTDFADGTHYNDPRIVGHALQVFWNEVNRYLELADGEWTPTPTGIQILIPEFDALTTHQTATFKIYIKDPDVYSDAEGGETGGTTESGGVAVPFSGDGFYELEAGHLLERVVIIPGSAADIKIGTSAGGSQISPEIPCTQDGEVVEINRFSLGGMNVHFTGVPANSVIVFFTKEVNLS